MPVVFRLMLFMPLDRPACGVKTAVQLIPPSLLENGDRLPPGAPTLPLPMPVTASEKLIVMIDVSPVVSSMSLMAMVAPGAMVSTVYRFELVLPAPLLPAASVTAVLSSVMPCSVASVFANGVNVALHCLPSPPSLDTRFDRLPPVAWKAPSVRPLTASLKVIVTWLVSPALIKSSATTMAAVGALVSTAYCCEVALPVPALPVTRPVTPAWFSETTLPVLSTPAAGVKVPVQVTPPSLEPRPLTVPLPTLRSLLSKPLTASEKVMVTVALSSPSSSVSSMTMVALGPGGGKVLME